MDLSVVSQFHKDQLLSWFMHHLTMEQRGKLVASVPEAYNAVCGDQLVVVVRKCDIAPYLNDEAGIDVAPFCFTGRPA